MKLRHDIIASGVNVVAAAHDGKRAGLAVAWATQVTTEHVLVCVGPQSTTRQLILDSGAFGLSGLGSGQLDVARLFGMKSSNTVDKLEIVPTHTLETGSPLLDECVFTLDCRVEKTFDFVDGKLIVGRVVQAEEVRSDWLPLIYREEDYHLKE